MPRFFFDVLDGDLILHDDDGTELPTRQEARLLANRLLPDIAKEELADGENRRFEAIVREGQIIIYRAVLTFHGEWVN